MKIKVLLNIGNASGLPPLSEGEHDVSREDGLALIERGWAVATEKPAATLKAVPTPPSIEAATEKATEDLQSHRAKQSRTTDSKLPANKEQ
jgi:hypothetical protein